MIDVAMLLTTHLRGRTVSAVELREHEWAFAFGDQIELATPCPWRIVASGRLAFADTDHDQQFGLPSPLDGTKEARRLLEAKRVNAASVRQDTGDLVIAFDDGTLLELLNGSCAYEGWRINLPDTELIALGGGEIAIIK